jgi:cell envelope opacity-associated protein A
MLKSYNINQKEMSGHDTPMPTNNMNEAAQVPRHKKISHGAPKMVQITAHEPEIIQGGSSVRIN